MTFLILFQCFEKMNNLTIPYICLIFSSGLPFDETTWLLSFTSEATIVLSLFPWFVKRSPKNLTIPFTWAGSIGLGRLWYWKREGMRRLGRWCSGTCHLVIFSSLPGKLPSAPSGVRRCASWHTTPREWLLRKWLSYVFCHVGQSCGLLTFSGEFHFRSDFTSSFWPCYCTAMSATDIW